MQTRVFDNSIRKRSCDFVDYILSKCERSVIIDSHGVNTCSVDSAMLSFELRNRSVPNNSMHMVLSLSNAEAVRTDNRTLKKIVRSLLCHAGWQNSQYIAVKHTNVRDNPHCHLVINLEDLDRRCFDSYCAGKLRISSRKLTEEFFPDIHVGSNELESEFRNQMISTIRSAVKESQSMSELDSCLAMEMIKMKISDSSTVCFAGMGESKFVAGKELAHDLQLSDILHYFGDETEDLLYVANAVWEENKRLDTELKHRKHQNSRPVEKHESDCISRESEAAPGR